MEYAESKCICLCFPCGRHGYIMRVRSLPVHPTGLSHDNALPSIFLVVEIELNQFLSRSDTSEVDLSLKSFSVPPSLGKTHLCMGVVQMITFVNRAGR